MAKVRERLAAIRVEEHTARAQLDLVYEMIEDDVPDPARWGYARRVKLVMRDELKAIDKQIAAASGRRWTTPASGCGLNEGERHE